MYDFGDRSFIFPSLAMVVLQTGIYSSIDFEHDTQEIAMLGAGEYVIILYERNNDQTAFGLYQHVFVLSSAGPGWIDNPMTYLEEVKFDVGM